MHALSCPAAHLISEVGAMMAEQVGTMVLTRDYSHYFKDVSNFKVIDVYRVLDLWGVTDPCIQHALKKLLCAGQRGGKNMAKDIKEVIASCERWFEMQQENANERTN
jgi:hypothetical protein